MFISLADWIESLVRDRKLRWLIAIPATIASIVLAIGILGQFGEVVNITLLASTIFLLAVVMILALARRYMRGQAIRSSKVVSRYADAIFQNQQSNPHYFTIEKWHESQFVGKRGDTSIVREIHIKAGANPVPAVWARASRSTEQHLSAQIKDDIKVEARYINGDDTDGTRLVCTHSWESEKGIRITVFFDQELEPGSTASIRLFISWPRYSADLLDKEPSKEYWKFHRAIDELNTTITYSKSFAPNGVRVTPLAGSSAPTVQKGRADGSTSVTLFVSTVTPGREYGYHVEIAP